MRKIVPAPAKPLGIEELGRQAADRIYGFFVVVRILIAPLIAGFAIWILANDRALWRQVGMGFVAAAMLSVSTVDLYNYRRAGLRGPFTVTRNLVMMGLAALFMCFATGALESPFLFVLPLMTLANAVFAPRRVGKAMVFGVMLPMVWIFAFVSVYSLVPGIVPDVFGGGARTARPDALLWATAVILTAITVAIISVGRRLRGHIERLLTEQLERRDEALRTHAEASRALTTLSGEIAHELKNPLASVKGLAALVAKDLDGKTAERMTVLRREVDRMQATLQEFLNFSRPFAPLSEEPMDLEALCRDVVELHAGLAEQAGVSIVVEAMGDPTLVCDARKVKQVLINVLQNALDAAPRETTVTVSVDGREGESVAVRVVDRGPGIAETLEGRLFEPGVTAKEEGSGLGLTVARLVARQHGGELTVVNGVGGGCVAELVLPRRPEVEVAGAERRTEQGGAE